MLFRSKHSLKELENRAFLNQITSVGFEGGSAEQPKFIDLEPLPPTQPEKGQALATPFAIQISDDDSTLIASAAGSDKLFTVDAAVIPASVIPAWANCSAWRSTVCILSRSGLAWGWEQPLAMPDHSGFGPGQNKL